MIAMRAKRAPASMPGKNPTATAAPGKRGQSGALPTGAALSESMPAVDAAGLVEVGEVEDDSELLAVELVASSITHWLLSQE